MFATFARLFNSKRPFAQPKRLHKRPRSLQLEHMEDRKLMAVSSIKIESNELRITGNNLASDVSINLVNGKYQVKDAVNGINKSYVTSGIKAIVFNGGAGNDKVVCNVPGLSFRAYGNDGNDTLTGNSGNDLLAGGAGKDALYGNSGNDKLLGGANVDRLFGGAGEDYLHGGSGDDFFDGGSGNDTFRRSLTIGGFFTTDPIPDDEQGNEPAEVAGAFLINDHANEDSPFDVDQQQTPTCAFLGALSAVAARSNSSNDLVSAIRYDAGRDQYAIKIWVNGNWTTQYVNGDWTEGRDPGGAMWVTLYQKAYLQAWGVQTRDADGRLLAENKWVSKNGDAWKNAGNALDSISRGFSKFTASKDASFTTLKSQYEDSGVYGMTASSNTSTTGGVVAQHVYAIYNVFTKSNQNWVQLYNPWGHDRSGASTDGNDDGLITLTWSQFTANFRGYHKIS